MRSVPDWDTYFMQMLPAVSARSKDPRTRTACIIVGPNREIRSTGYNGFPRRVNDLVPERWDRESGEKYKWCEHAERNAIYNAARCGTRTDGCTIYVIGLLPCVDCARAIIQSGMVRVVADHATHRANTSEKWEPDVQRVLTMFREADVKLEWFS